jgi:hypothetical protein
MRSRSYASAIYLIYPRSEGHLRSLGAEGFARPGEAEVRTTGRSPLHTPLLRFKREDRLNPLSRSVRQRHFSRRFMPWRGLPSRCKRGLSALVARTLRCKRCTSRARRLFLTPPAPFSCVRPSCYCLSPLQNSAAPAYFAGRSCRVAVENALRPFVRQHNKSSPFWAFPPSHLHSFFSALAVVRILAKLFYSLNFKLLLQPRPQDGQETHRSCPPREPPQEGQA